MVATFLRKLSPCFWSLIMAISITCSPAGKSARAGTAPDAQAGPAAAETPQPVAVTPSSQPNVVGQIRDYIILKEEFVRRLTGELNPYAYESYSVKSEPVNARSVLEKMIAEKAMVMEARKQNMLESEMLRTAIGEYRDRKLVNLLLQKQLQSKLIVTPEEVEAKVKADPNLDKARARAVLERTKANQLLDAYYKGIYEKSRVNKLTENFAKAAEIHQRLLYKPQTERKVGFIRDSQVRDELTEEEKNLVLATYSKGKITLKDWFEKLCDFSPPSRPRDLGTAKGVERFLDIVLKMPLLASEGERLGLDKDAGLLKQVRDYEDTKLFGAALTAKYEQVQEATDSEAAEYFSENKDLFITDRTINIDQIWCADLAAARRVKAELDGGADFQAVKEKYSLQKESKPLHTYPGGEGYFWSDLWKGEPNQVLGPLKGFYKEQFKWRVVKVLQKRPGEVKEYSDNMKNAVKRKIMSDKREALLEKYYKELLEKYPHKIYDDRIKGIDPLNIP
ncbi:MAG: hypothetical protein JSU94_03675 [Phycisphaerales bacterium]|nr:MAG: hypothetical protein JSU94_03675 [Phycisphaerales bacterium]